MKTTLSENLRLNVPRNDLFIRALNIVILIVLLGFCIGQALAAEKPADAPKADPIAELTKERDELKSKLATSEQQAGNLQAQNQYLSVLAERNEMAVRLLQANARADDLQKQLDAEKVKVAELEKKQTPPAK
jgi:Tfp pilus assembly protein PilO